MQAYSQDLRDRVLGALERGESPTAIAERYEVSRVWVYQVKKRLEESALRVSLPIGGHRVSRVATAEKQVRGWIAHKPDLTLAEICERLQSGKGIRLKVPALWHQLNKWGLSYKKNAARQRARTRGREGGARSMAASPTHVGGRQTGLSG